MNDEPKSIEDMANLSWHKYNTAVIFELIEGIGDFGDYEGLEPDQVIAIRTMYVHAFMCGVQFKLTGELSEQHNDVNAFL
jgi:hypothetical protein